MEELDLSAYGLRPNFARGTAVKLLEQSAKEAMSKTTKWHKYVCFF